MVSARMHIFKKKIIYSSKYCSEMIPMAAVCYSLRNLFSFEAISSVNLNFAFIKGSLNDSFNNVYDPTIGWRDLGRPVRYFII